MKPLRNIMSVTILPLIMFSFSQCSSQMKLQEKAPVTLEAVYFENWIAGARGAGAGTDIYIPVAAATNTKIQLDSVYFRGKAVKLELKSKNTSLYIGRFISDKNKMPELIMSSDAKEEYGNKMPAVPEKIPFDLKDNECVVSYKEGGETKYFKIDGVVQKRSANKNGRPY